jgi:hypothetical protein
MTTRFRVDDRQLLASVLDGEGSHLGPAAVIDGLGNRRAHVLLAGMEQWLCRHRIHGHRPACQLGQIITMRQLMGLWPPPSGTITW